MSNQQQNSFLDNWKRNFNFIHFVSLIHQRAIVVVCRDKWGKQALGTPCALALLMMFLWAYFTRDPFMWAWMIFWSLCFLRRRMEAIRLAGFIHSMFDGWPKEANRYRCSEKTAKRWIEPLLVGIMGGLLLWFYREQGWRPTGLPYFLLTGVFTLPFVETVKKTIWENRLQAMQDAKIEQGAAVREFRDRYGDL
jgi:hypothetical protein